MVIDFHISTFLFLLITISTFLFFFQKKLKLTNFRFEFIVFLVFYSLFLVKATILPIWIFDKDTLKETHDSTGDFMVYYQIVPFKTIRNYFINNAWIQQIGGNLLLLMPIPLIFSVTSKIIRYKRIIIFGMMLSLGIEIIQLAINITTQFPIRVADIDDIIINTTGVVIGIGVSVAIQKYGNLRNFIRRFVYSCEDSAL